MKPKLSPYRQSLLYYLVFCASLLAGVTYELNHAYREAENNVAQRTAQTGYLIGEWIKGAFESSDYVLRDMVDAISLTELQYPNSDQDKFEQRLQYLERKKTSLPNVIFAGYFDHNCIATHSLLPSHLGIDASLRPYCSPLLQDPTLETWVTEAFPALNGPINVSQVRRLAADDSGFVGLAGIAVDLSFFDKWLDNLKLTDDSWVFITDTRQLVLAEHPPIRKVGHSANYPWLTEFLASKSPQASIGEITTTDGIKRFASIRKIENLPLVVVVAESQKNWLGDWYEHTFSAISALVLIFMMAGLALRYHWSLLTQRNQLWELANHDPLTNVANRRHFFAQAQHELDRLDRSSQGLALLILDIDYFKQINDFHGHASGDMAIIHFAKICRSSLRGIDILGRIGGDEFAIVLSDIDLAGSKIAAERLIMQFRNSPVANQCGEPILLSASIGMTYTNTAEASLEELLSEADTALYQAKANGRNQYVLMEKPIQNS